VVSALDAAAQVFMTLAACVAEQLRQDGLARYSVGRERDMALVLET
jgi:hypothetical protein